MEIGRLNRKVDVLEFKYERDDFGGQDGRWVPIMNLWANISPVSGTEYFSMQKVDAETVVTITVRYNPKITVMHRIRYQTKVFEIIGVSDADTAHSATILNCKEMVNDELQRKAKESKGRR